MYIYIYIFLEENKKGRGIEQPKTVKFELFLSVFDFLDLFYTWRRKMKKTWREKIKSQKNMYIYTYIYPVSIINLSIQKKNVKLLENPFFQRLAND